MGKEGMEEEGTLHRKSAVERRVRRLDRSAQVTAQGRLYDTRGTVFTKSSSLDLLSMPVAAGTVLKYGN